MAEEEFWSAWADRGVDTMKSALGLEESRIFFEEWFAADFVPGTGGTLMDRFLAREGDRLRTGERRYLERMHGSHLRPYEVVRVRPEEGLDLRDLWTRDTIRVAERRGTRQLVRFDVLCARIVLGPTGEPVIDWLPYLLPVAAAEPLLKSLRRMHRAYKKQVPHDTLGAFFKSVGMVFHYAWLDHVALRALPHMVTAEGDDFVFARVIFDVRDMTRMTAALEGCLDLERQDNGRYAWSERGEERRRGLGTFVVEAARLVFETTSKPRAERGRQFVEELGGDAARFRATEYEGVERAMKRMERKPVRATDEIPADVQARLTGQFYEQHYRAWPDTPLPALGGRTPREAALLKSVRPRLVALLKQFETGAERDRRAGRPAYDFGWMWGELGMERPE